MASVVASADSRENASVSLSRSQRGVAFGMAVGLGITLAGFAVAISVGFPDGSRDASELRLQILALCALAPSLALAIAIGRLAAHRFRTPQDIDGSGLTAGTARARRLQALLQNTLEQSALALPIYAAWAALAPERWMAALPAAATLFLLGRALFFRGYGRGATGRSLGFALTFYPTLVLLTGAIVLGFLAVGS